MTNGESKQMKQQISLLAALGLLIMMACQPGTAPEESETHQEPPPAPQVDPAYASLTSIPVEAMQDLYSNCNSLDIVFYEETFSLSQNDPTQIQSTLRYLTPAPVTYNPACKPIGRITFWVQGELRREADIYNGDACSYFIWLDGTKPQYINALTAQGIEFFKMVLTRAHEMNPQQ